MSSKLDMEGVMGWRKIALASIWGLVAAAYAGLAALYFTEPTRESWIAAVTAVALATELAFWATAAILGVTIWQSRKAIFRFLTRPFRRRA
jgi:hypothetical protein